MNSNYDSADTAGLDRNRIPSHVAIIMDGSGRWAKKRLLNRVRGHEQGSETVRTIVRTSRELGISYLTLYAFSTENWQRPKAEVSALMGLLSRFLKSELKEMQDNNIRLNAIGQIDRLPHHVRHDLLHAMSETKINDGMVLSLCLSYGGRSEITKMVVDIAQQVSEGNLAYTEISEALISRHLYTKDIPDPDLLIRTSGEFRISNFLLWQIAYSEIFITDTLWPDFGRDEYIKILEAYQCRDRRYGKVQ